jgi:2-keto-4-pentenoate hydratase
MAEPILYGVAAQRLAVARRTRAPGGRLEAQCRPSNIEEALEIQRQVRMILNEPVGGWKCSLPGPIVMSAPIYAPDMFTASPCPVIADGGLARAEPEIAFVLGRDLPPRDSGYSETEIDSAIAETRLVLELVGGRYAEPADLSFPELLADHLSNQGLFVGPLVLTDPREIRGEFRIAVAAYGAVLMECDGRHPDGHPLRAFHALVQFLTRQGEALTNGQVFITGSYAGVLQLPIGVAIRIRFGDLGVLDVEFRAAGLSLTI